MAEPINYDRPVAGVGLGGSFAAMWCMENEEEKIGLIPCAEGGSSLDDWAIDKIIFKHAVCQAKFAMEDTEGEKMYLEMLNFGPGKMSYEEFLAKVRKETD